MGKYEDIERDHFRFPAYDDVEGVKLSRSEKTTTCSASDDWILTEQEEKDVQTIDRDQRELQKSLRRSPKKSQETTGQSLQQREELKKHRENLPDYSKHTTRTENNSIKRKLFGDKHKKATQKVQIPTPEVKVEQKPKATTRQEKAAAKKPFAPKYVPASKQPVANETVAPVETLDKSKDSYLLFDVAPAAYQEKKVDDPSVQKFQQAETKKHGVLEKDLAGMIEEGHDDLAANRYFNKDEN